MSDFVDLTTDVITELKRIADAQERISPPHGWEYRRVGWLHHDDPNKPQGAESLENLNNFSGPRWEVMSEPQSNYIGYLIRRPRQAPNKDTGKSDLPEIGVDVR